MEKEYKIIYLETLIENEKSTTCLKESESEFVDYLSDIFDNIRTDSTGSIDVVCVIDAETRQIVDMKKAGFTNLFAELME